MIKRTGPVLTLPQKISVLLRSKLTHYIYADVKKVQNLQDMQHSSLEIRKRKNSNQKVRIQILNLFQNI